MPISTAKVIFIEPYYGGSHKALIDILAAEVTDHEIVTLPAKKWHWRARCGAISLFQRIPKITSQEILFCSSVLNLAELLGLRSDLQCLKKIVYFHENQLVYPVREIKARDIQYSYNQITTCLAADVVLFNSDFNKTSFLSNIKNVMKILPDCRPKDLHNEIQDKCKILYFPVKFPEISLDSKLGTEVAELHIVWPHRWEFDKGPDEFFHTLFKIKEQNVKFKVSVLGETFTDNPLIFQEAKLALKEEIVNFGYIDDKTDYFKILQSAHVVVSTAKHEFFGVSMLEAAFCGCFPLAPNKLSYPEIYPKECLYSSHEDLFEKLHDFCINPMKAVIARRNMDLDFNKYSSCTILSTFKDIIKVL